MGSLINVPNYALLAGGGGGGPAVFGITATAATVDLSNVTSGSFDSDQFLAGNIYHVYLSGRTSGGDAEVPTLTLSGGTFTEIQVMPPDPTMPGAFENNKNLTLWELTVSSDITAAIAISGYSIAHWIAGIVLEITDGVSPPDQITLGTTELFADDTEYPLTLASPPAGDSGVIYVVFRAGTATWTPDAGWTQLVELTEPAGDAGIYIQTKIGDQSADPTISSLDVVAFGFMVEVAVAP